MNSISPTDLILNEDGSVYHLNLLPQDVADTIITVGDPDRVPAVSQHFDTIELKKGKREFITHTGTMHGKRLTVISTGIGTDNIDIVLNELDALANIDLETLTVKPNLRRLNIIRIGTSGGIQPDVEVNSILVSSAAFGLDPLMHYYKHDVTEDESKFRYVLADILQAAYGDDHGIHPYYVSAGHTLLQKLGGGLAQGITITAPGFYAPQGRHVRAEANTAGFVERIQSFEHQGHRITNLEMETAGIYGLARALGHQALSFNVILANRATNVFSKRPAEIMDNAIISILERILTL